MGLWSWLFPSPEQRVERARAMLREGRAEFARLEVLELDAPGAREVLVEAETELCRRNLEAAENYGRAGEDERALECLELASKFHHRGAPVAGGLEGRFTAVRRELRELRQARDQAEERARAEKKARLMAVDPLGITGGPSWLDPVRDESVLDPDQEELAARLALMVENYPEALRGRVSALGSEFASAVIALDDGQPQTALQALLALPDDEPLVCWERARAAHALGDPIGAARAVRAFAKHAGGHSAIGALHTGVFLAQMLAESGDLPGAVRVLRDVRASEPKAGALLFAQLLLATGAQGEAERVLVGLVRDHPREPALYPLLARAFLAQGRRADAMRALEAGLQTCCGTPGRCGSRPPDLETHRLLATLYLEDGSDQARGLELAGTAASLVDQPIWEDAYLQVLAARARNEPDADELARRLTAATPPGHPGVERIERYLTG